MLIKPDFSECSDPLEHGEYKARIADLELKETSTGKQQLKFSLEIFGHEKEEYNGRKVSYFAMLSGGGAFKLRSIWKAATGKLLPKDVSELNTEEVAGKSLIIVMGPEKDQNGNVKEFPGVVATKELTA